jgi:3-dehydroquinate synthase
VKLVVQSRHGSYPVEVGPGLFAGLGSMLRAAGVDGRVAVVTDTHVRRLWSDPVMTSLATAGLEPLLLEIPAGEGSKTLARADALWGQLIEARFTRADTVVALGGGVVGDLAGFAAATFHRGMRLVQAPTTLLAQVDSAIGGKVAIDHPLGKNLVGTFHPPIAVVADVGALQTLPERERWNGLAEVVKTALVLDAELFDELEIVLTLLGRGLVDAETWTGVVGRTAGLKARVVSEDELEGGPRMLLNFGHTLAHALESATGHGPLTHGEAVVLGMRAAVAVSEGLGRLPATDAERIRAVLDRFPPPPKLERPPREAVRAAVSRDKKARSGQLRYVVLDGVGRGAIEPGLSPALQELAVDVALEPL